MISNYIITLVLTALACYVLTPFSMRVAKKIDAIDYPNEERKKGQKPTPRFGGFAVIVAFLTGSMYLLILMHLEHKLDIYIYKKAILAIVISTILITILGLKDDTKGMSAKNKFLLQALIAIITIILGIRIQDFQIPFITEKLELGRKLSYLVTFLWIVGIMNAINLIDGLDGLSSSLVLTSILFLIVICFLDHSPIIGIIFAIPLAGAIIGFLPYNMEPAKTYIGDIGTNFMGYMLSVIAILGVAKTYTAITLIAPIIILLVPIFDTFFAIIRRIVKAKSLKGVFLPDKGHVHHRLSALGLRPKHVVFILCFITTLAGTFAVILMEGGIIKAISYILLLLLMAFLGYNDFFSDKIYPKLREGTKKKKKKDE